MEKNKILTLSQLEPLCILRMLLRNLWLVALAACIGWLSASAFLIGDVSRSYSSTATFVVTPQGGSYSSGFSAAAVSAKSYADLLDSDLMHRMVKDSLNGECQGTITANQIGSTNLIAVTVSSDTPADALRMMQVLAAEYGTLSGYISSSATLSLLNTPSLSTLVQSTFNSSGFASVAALGCGALMVAILLAFILFTGTVQNEQAAKDLLDGKLLVTVPHERGMNLWLRGPHRSKNTPNINSPNVSFHFAESIHRMAETFEREQAEGKRIFLLTSVLETEGKSTVAMNVALSLALKKKRVLFLDLDLRRPVQARNLGVSIPQRQNLGTLLEQRATPREIISNAVPIQDTSMYALLSTKSFPNSAQLIASKTLSDLLEHSRKYFDYIIIDLPPAGYFSEGEIMLDQADAAVLVVRQDVVPAAVVNDCIDALRGGRAEFLGYVLNDVNTLSGTKSTYGYNKYGYHGGYSYGKQRSGKANDSK
jgi:capsular exopolysaccharide synthesis family protein